MSDMPNKIINAALTVCAVVTAMMLVLVMTKIAMLVIVALWKGQWL